ncbi:hypothetical protein A4G99_13675 [Haladaptatus sp. R4]|uniref:hypothetical protein n=1 Tax=Haladaptatus sp. R4 TaxID=1679489 RepID=UPI0007B479F9|nr:hypothetical protein [Haladaptatus sp. R4]KZN23881.1 hypothetical protein A4G99_13675 [Haladaptatus sp. R4]
MSEPTRRALITSVGATLIVAGCISDSGGGAPTDELSTNSTTDVTISTAALVSPGLEETDRSHSIEVQNDAGRNEPSASGSSANRPERPSSTRRTRSRRTAGYNLKDANPEGVEAFRICAELVDSKETETSARTTSDFETVTADGTTAQTTTKRKPTADTWHYTTAETSECYGNYRITVEKDGAFSTAISMC